jgi:exodeoxyribonuclease-3
MRIATYNVNSVNARLPVLLRWLTETRPDVACLQELKAPQEKFPADALRDAGYHAIWHGRKAWNGVAILARTHEIVETGRGLLGDPDDGQSRYLEGTAGGVRVGCLYLPNGNPAPGPKFDYKLRWLERLAARAAELVALPEPVVLAGDYNVLPEEIDVHNPAGWEADALFRPETREAYRRLLAQVRTDAIRRLNPGEQVFTFCDYTGGSWRRNAGLRIDHLLLNPSAARRLSTAGVGQDVRGWGKTSDHAPTWAELGDEKPDI